MPLGLTPVLATFTGQVASWQLQDLSSAISAYAGTTARVVFRYESGNSFTGDLQLDAITLGGTTAGFESGIDSYQTSTSSDDGTSAYSSVTSWTSLATGTFPGRWNRWTGNTPSSGTGDLGAYAGSYFVYAETTAPGNPSKYFWLRGPEIVVTPATLEFALGRQGATIGTLKVYLDITAGADVTVPLSGWGFSTWGTDSWGEGQALPVGTGEVGSVAVAAGAVITLTGVVGTTALGTATAAATATIYATGVQGTGIAAYAVWDATVYFGGWGRGEWGQGAWGESLGLEATGVVGTVSVQEGASATVTGVVGTTALGNIAVNGDGAISALGNAATGEVGTVEIDAGAIVAVTGVIGTTALGTAGVQSEATVYVTGVAGTTV
jgi:hypothetical protein